VLTDRLLPTGIGEVRSEEIRHVPSWNMGENAKVGIWAVVVEEKKVSITAADWNQSLSSFISTSSEGEQKGPSEREGVG